LQDGIAVVVVSIDNLAAVISLHFANTLDLIIQLHVVDAHFSLIDLPFLDEFLNSHFAPLSPNVCSVVYKFILHCYTCIVNVKKKIIS